MPEWGEVRIMADFINANDAEYTEIIQHKTKVKTDLACLEGPFRIKAESYGKEVRLIFNNQEQHLYFSMGMSGFWDFVPNNLVDTAKWTKLQFNTGNHSLLMRDTRNFAKWRWGNDFGSNRSPDPVRDNDKWKNNILSNLHKTDFKKPVYEWLLNQKWNNGTGNYCRSTILFYMDINPFQSAADYINAVGDPFFIVVKEILETSYALGGGQLMDWKNPFNLDSQDFKNWVFYQKGCGIKDSADRTFWFHPKFEKNCELQILYRR